MQINKPDNTLQIFRRQQRNQCSACRLFPARLRHFHLGTDDSYGQSTPEAWSGCTRPFASVHRYQRFYLYAFGRRTRTTLWLQKSRHHRCNADGTNFRAAFLPAKHLELCHCTCFFRGQLWAATDVSMNTNAVIVEKLAGRRLLSGMHAFWSIGCFASAGLF